jgi:predicted ATPase
MRIAISGSQGVGKSTLMADLELNIKLKGIVFIKEIVRSLAMQGIKINREADHFSQCAILEEHYKNQLRHRNMITDRCSIDAFVYATYDYLQGKYTLEEHLKHERMMLRTLNDYDQYFYIPVEFEMSVDGVRDTDVKYQKAIDDLFKVVYDKYDIQPIILKGSVEKRKQTFLENVCSI